MNKIRETLKQMAQHASMTRRLLVHNAEIVLDMLESLEMTREIKMSFDENGHIICFTITVRTPPIKTLTLIYEVTADGFKWSIL